jgi:hypothetical protein
MIMIPPRVLLASVFSNHLGGPTGGLSVLELLQAFDVPLALDKVLGKDVTQSNTLVKAREYLSHTLSSVVVTALFKVGHNAGCRGIVVWDVATGSSTLK